MDGTLVDTESNWIAAEYRLVESYGHTWNDQHAHNLIGSALLHSARYIREHGHVPLEPEEIVDRLLAEVIAGVNRHLEWRPGALSLLAELSAAGIPMALVTMSYRNLAGVVAAQAPGDPFEVLVCGDDVRRGKPDPEAYLTAAERLGVEPARCVAIEDSPSGIAAAEAAGCVVIAVPNQVPIDPAPTRTVWPSLAGVRLTDLDRLMADRLAV